MTGTTGGTGNFNTADYVLTGITNQSTFTATSATSTGTSYGSGGTATMVCNNSTDALTGNRLNFASTLTMPAYSSPLSYLVHAQMIAYEPTTSPAFTGGELYNSNNYDFAAATAFTPANAQGWSYSWNFDYVASSYISATLTNLAQNGRFSPQYFPYTGSTFTLAVAQNWFAATGIGIPTYSTGGTPTGTGSCLLAASGGGGTGGELTMNVVGGSFSSFAVANTGYAYTAEPTSWTYVSGTACSTTVTTTSGTLGGAQGAAVRLIGFYAK